MNRFRLTAIWVVFLACAVVPPPAHSKHRDTPFKVYMAVWRGCEDSCRGVQDYFREEGIDVDFIVRDADGDNARLPAFVREAKALAVDLVVTSGASVTAGMAGTIKGSDPARHITDIPVVFMVSADPAGVGIIDSDASSARANITGIRHRVPEEVQMKAIRAYRYFKRLGMIYDTSEPNAVLNVENMRRLARKMRFYLFERPLDLDENGKPVIASVPRKIKELKRRNVDFIYVGSSDFLMGHSDYFTNAAILQGLPVVSAHEAMARKSNALLAVYSRYYSAGKLAGLQAKNILINNIAPMDLPVLNHRGHSYVINMETARQLRLYPPIAVLRYAEVVN